MRNPVQRRCCQRSARIRPPGNPSWPDDFCSAGSSFPPRPQRPFSPRPPGKRSKIIGQLHLRITHPIPDKKEHILRRSRLHRILRLNLFSRRRACRSLNILHSLRPRHRFAAASLEASGDAPAPEHPVSAPASSIPVINNETNFFFTLFIISFHIVVCTIDRFIIKSQP